MLLRFNYGRSANDGAVCCPRSVLGKGGVSLSEGRWGMDGFHP
jgi:hypothetical protein